MAEGFETVRIIRQHLRRSAALLDEGKFDDALGEVTAALALDPQSVPAQALRDRIQAARVSRPTPVSPVSTPTSRAFVPHGVNAASWRGFEQRITERRFKALLDSINTSIVTGDAASARLALEEARELRPEAPELATFEARVAAVPVVAPAASATPAPRVWMRATGAAALFLIGVSLLLGLEWMRPDEPAAPPPVVAPELPAVAPPAELRPTVTPDLGAVPIALNDEESVPAVEMPPEPLLRPRATTGGATGGAPALPAPEAVADAAPKAIAMQPIAMRESAPPAVERTLERRPVAADAPVRTAEVPDEFVVPQRNASAASDLERAGAPAVRTPDVPVVASTTNARLNAAAATPATASAVVIPSAMEQSRVEEVLQRYARAYGALDVGAAREVWPSVDEKALVRAFQNLSSQRVSFDDCEIDIRGVSANASCRGQFSFVGKVGSREPRTESRTWRFELKRNGDAWTIEGVDARRASTLDYR